MSGRQNGGWDFSGSANSLVFATRLVFGFIFLIIALIFGALNFASKRKSSGISNRDPWSSSRQGMMQWDGLVRFFTKRGYWIGGCLSLIALFFFSMSAASYVQAARYHDRYSEWNSPSIAAEESEYRGAVFATIGFTLFVPSVAALAFTHTQRQKQGWADVKVAIPEITSGDTSPTSSLEGLIYAIRLPRDTHWDSGLAYRFTDQLLFAFPFLILQVQADSTGIEWQIVDLSLQIESEVIEQTVRSIYPDADVLVTEYRRPHEPISEPFHRYIGYYTQANMFVAPILYLEHFKETTPLASLAEIMSGLRPGERLIYSIALMGYAEDAYDKGERLITQSTIHPLQYLSRSGIGDAISKQLSGRDRTSKYVWQDQKVFEEKLRQRLARAMMFIQVDAPQYERVVELFTLANNQTTNFTHMPYNGVYAVARHVNVFTTLVQTSEQDWNTSTLGLYLSWASIPKPTRQQLHNQAPQMVLETREIAALWHLPNTLFKAPKIRWIPPGEVAISTPLASEAMGVYIGTGKYRGQGRAIYLHPDDRRLHINIIGKTGMGKSTFMHALIHQDIANGEGVAVIDPHGTLVRDILRTSIPPERESDVVVLDLADEQYPPPINPMRGNHSFVGLGRVLNVIEQLFDGTDKQVQLSKYLRAAVGLLQEDPTATMRDISHVFLDKNYRYRLLNSSDNPFVLDVWDAYEKLSPSQHGNLREPILSRIAPFYGNPTLYPMLCHPDRLDFKRFIQESKIVLISLAFSDEKVAEVDRNLMGALLIAMLQMSGMSEAASPFYVYIDEVQKFVTTSIDTMLSEARKFGLSLTIANQFLGQLEGKTLEAVMGNVGTTVLFRCSPYDARALGPHMRPHYDAENLVNLDRFKAAVKLQWQGQTQPAFTLWTPPPLKQTAGTEEREAYLRALSRKNYLPKDRKTVLSWLDKRYPRRIREVADNEADSYYDKGDKKHDT